MSKYYDKFIELLEEMFQFSNEDLDFGIYRIMNQKREEIRRFLEKDLLPQVKQAFQKYQSADQSQLRQELGKMRVALEAAGVEPETAPKYVQLKEQLSKSVDLDGLESEVFSDLTNFFRRYYNNGDFVSNRRYKKDVYAIPYEGEEVKLHWANADQYYVKTTENFRNYSFELPSKRKVHFTLVEASTEQNNNKEQRDKERQFILTEENPLEEIQGELYIRFEYRFADDKAKREVLNAQAIERINRLSEYHNWLEELQKPYEKNPNKTILEKHLNDYTAKNKFDYFIHKDLGGFLRRELDFFIKNEIIHLDDLDTENEARIEQYLSKIKVIKSIGHKIIAFLEQIENFQKKLWLKKKFVVDTQYCITLDHVPEQLYPEIIKNEAQLQEWIRLFAIDEIAGDLTTPGFTNPLTVEFLRANPYLMLDTKFFDSTFKDRLLMSIDDLDANLDGLLIHSENFQALTLMKKKYAAQVDCVYIDPPYNTVHSEILYKNQFKHSSWLSLIANTARVVPAFWQRTFSFGIAIDDYEFVNLAALCDTLFPELERNIIVVNHHPQGSGGRISRTHEYFILLSPSDAPAYLGEPLEDYQEDRSFMRSGTAENNFRYGRWKSFYALLLDPKNNQIVDAEEPVPLGQPYPTDVTKEGYVRIYPINTKGEERVWRSSYETGKQRIKNGEIIISDKGTVYQTIDHESKREVLFSNWTDSKYNSGMHGSNLLRSMGLGNSFDYPKSIYTLETALWAQTYGKSDALILDYFAGSGTTGHAVINLNRVDNGKRKYILVEMGEYFNTATKPRIQKAIYSKDWKDGKPSTREGISHMFKYIRLESYEDTLNNLELRRTNQQQLAIDAMESGAKEQYLLSYMLDMETKGSASLLNLSMFENPFEYKLRITQNNETRITNVDLVETFNYLLGLSVKQVEVIQGFKVVKGNLPSGKQALIIWRNLKEKSNDDLEEFFKKQRYSTLDTEFDYIYVNGDNHLENLKKDEDRWKVMLIEEEFQRLMFDVSDV